MTSEHKINIKSVATFVVVLVLALVQTVKYVDVFFALPFFLCLSLPLSWQQTNEQAHAGCTGTPVRNNSKGTRGHVYVCELPVYCF